jgi:hypothetical protein
MRQCFIHIGTHRTATTSLQTSLSSAASVLRSHNYLYPLSGRPPETPDGHHNIAWELSGDRRFRSEYGSISDLMAEIHDFPGDVILSSEDFECSVFSEERFRWFVHVLQRNDLAVHIIVYLRNQIDYAESLYRVMLRFGVRDPFDEFLRKVINEGQFCWQEWILSFCYKQLLASVESIENASIVVRSYDNPVHGSIIDDYFSILGLSAASLPIDSSIRLNANGTIAESIRMFYQNGKGSPLDALEDQVIDGLCQSIGTRKLPLLDQSRHRLVLRFQESNELIQTRYGINLTSRGQSTTLRRDSENGDDEWCTEELFSEAFRHQIDRLARLSKHDCPGTIDSRVSLSRLRGRTRA